MPLKKKGGGTVKTTIALNLCAAVHAPVTILNCDVEEPNVYLFLIPTGNRRKITQFKILFSTRIVVMVAENTDYIVALTPLLEKTARDPLKSETPYGPLVHGRLGRAQSASVNW